MKTLKKTLLSLMMSTMLALCIGQWAMAGGADPCPPNSCASLCEFEAKPIGTCYIDSVPHDLHRSCNGTCYMP